MPFDMFNQFLQDIKDSPVAILFEKGEEFRRRLIKVFCLLVVFFVAFFYFSKEMVEFLKGPLIQNLPPSQSKLYFKDPLEGFSVMFKTSLLGALTLVLPYALWQIMKFIEPIVPQEHRKLLKPYFLSSLFLFCLGSGFCFAAILPSALSFLVEMGADIAEPLLMIEDYISVLGWMLFGFGLVFQLPIVLILLGEVGLLSAAFLRENRKFALVINLAVAAILTPTPDPFSQIAMAVPMGLLYEIAILVIAYQEKKSNSLPMVIRQKEKP